MHTSASVPPHMNTFALDTTGDAPLPAASCYFNPELITPIYNSCSETHFNIIPA